MTPYMIAGIISGIVGLLVFLIIHHFWILPIWFIAPAGAVIAGLGGLAVGWSYSEIRTALPDRPWTFLVLTLLIAIILAPSIVLGQLRSPLVQLPGFTILPGKGQEAAIRFVLELIVTAVAVGAIEGWLLGRSITAMIATALAGLAYAIGPGHNIPLLGNTASAGKGLILLFIVTIVAAFVLVEASQWLMTNQTTNQ
jgi:hypothetical protein